MTFLRTIPILLATVVAIPAAEVACTEDDATIVLTRDGAHVLTYRKTAQLPEGVDRKYARSGFIHPVTTPSGRVLTDDYPQPHHAHQNGVFLIWRKAEFEGKELNFWEPSAATVRHARTLGLINGKDTAGFRVERAHVDGDEVVLTETWTVTVDAGTGHIDLHSEQRCATDSPLTLLRYHYGGMAIRGSRQWAPDTGDEQVAGTCRMVTNEGLTREKGNHSRPLWVGMSGLIDGQPASITLIPHPGNLRHPQHARLHPKMPYFCLLPTVEEPFTIEPGAPLVSRFRLIAADGEPDPAALDAAQRTYAKEP